MPKYLIQGSYTSEGTKGVRKDGGSKRRQVAEALIEQEVIKPIRLVFIEPHDRKAEYWFNKQYETFLLEEILPEVASKYNLSTDPAGRAIAGSSSGAICAFTVAWERPDAFSKVFSTIGTYAVSRVFRQTTAAFGSLPFGPGLISGGSACGGASDASVKRAGGTSGAVSPLGPTVITRHHRSEPGAIGSAARS